MRHTHLLIALLALLMSHQAIAKPKRNTSGSSQMDASAFFTCVQAAIYGRTDNDCSARGESDECIGARIALEFTLKKSYCYSGGEDGCSAYGHKHNSQPQWASVASGHVGNFLTCVRHRYGGDESSGTREALRDKGFVEFLRQIDDGGPRWGLAPGQLLLRTLEGEKLSHILSSSTRAKDLENNELALIKTGADNPAPLLDPEAIGKKTEPSSNLAQLGTNLLDAWTKAYGSQIEPADFDPTFWVWEPSKSQSAQNIASAQPPLGRGNGKAEKPVEAPIKAPEQSAPERSPASATAIEATAAPNSSTEKTLLIREYKENPYTLGLDRTLFDRISLRYRRLSPELQNIDYYLKAKTEQKSRDVTDEIRRGEAIEL